MAELPFDAFDPNHNVNLQGQTEPHHDLDLERRGKRCYNHPHMQEAVSEVLARRLNFKQAEFRYGVPRSTLQAHCRKIDPSITKPSPVRNHAYMDEAIQEVLNGAQVKPTAKKYNIPSGTLIKRVHRTKVSLGIPTMRRGHKFPDDEDQPTGEPQVEVSHQYNTRELEAEEAEMEADKHLAQEAEGEEVANKQMALEVSQQYSNSDNYDTPFVTYFPGDSYETEPSLSPPSLPPPPPPPPPKPVDCTPDFVTALTQFLQILNNGCIDFDETIQVRGHIYLAIDDRQALECALDEKICKTMNEALIITKSTYTTPVLTPDPRPPYTPDTHTHSLRPSPHIHSLQDLTAEYHVTNSLVTAEAPPLAPLESHVEEDTVGGGFEALMPDVKDVKPIVEEKKKRKTGRPKKTTNPSRTLCTECGKTFSRPSNLRVHETLAHGIGEPRFQCKFCGKRFHNKAFFEQHQDFHFERKSFMCAMCGKAFRYKPALTSHMKKIHHVEVKPLPRNPKTVVECRFCRRIFNGHAQLINHERIHSRKSSTSFPCTDCPMVFCLKRDLTIHKVKRHGAKEAPVVVKRSSGLSLQCEACSKTFSTSNNLRVHEILKHNKGEPRFTCHVCSKGFFNKAGFQGHLNSHSKTKNYKCDDCRKRFMWKKNLDYHRIRHHGAAGGVQCDKCLRIMARAEMPYHRVRSKCALGTLDLVSAGKSTQVVEQINGPVPSASKDNKNNKYICSLCSKTFSSTNLRDIHTEVYHATSESRMEGFECRRRCGTVCSSFDDYKSHVESCKHLKVFQCKLCSVGFNFKKNFIRHMTLFHEISMGDAESQSDKLNKESVNSEVISQSENDETDIDLNYFVEGEKNDEQSSSIQNEVLNCAVPAIDNVGS